MSALILLVNADPRALRHNEAVLSAEGYLVAASPSLSEAKKALASVMPDLLITDLHLGTDNGLALAIRCRFDYPDVPVIVTHTREDAFAEADAMYYGATFMAAPLTNPRFLPSVRSAVERRRLAQPPIRRWPRKPAVGVGNVITAAQTAQIIDVSYGGVRLAFGRPDSLIIPKTFTIALPESVVVRASRVWTARGRRDDELWCGAELSVASTEAWRQFVGALREAPAP